MDCATINLNELGGSFLGTRFEGRILRMELERALTVSSQVNLDFRDVALTQSCADEFVGVLFAQAGSPLLQRLIFAGCSDDVRAILQLVIGSRLQEREQLVRQGVLNAQSANALQQSYS